ncbi:MAG TPA: hypothetical protein VEL76_19045, partial [Gemmataceae bacterium]|nr:hypothetical protein [Gemmataceae bacterium]
MASLMEALYESPIAASGGRAGRVPIEPPVPPARQRGNLMSPSLRALLSGIIDYAGLFPPAKLPLAEALRNYAGYRTEPDSWMLGRFICPAARLVELDPFLKELFPSD